MRSRETRIAFQIILTSQKSITGERPEEDAVEELYVENERNRQVILGLICDTVWYSEPSTFSGFCMAGFKSFNFFSK